MRPLKYKNLGEMSIIRVPQTVISILPKLQDLMQQLEENDRDSVETISAVLDDIQERMSFWYHVPIVLVSQYTWLWMRSMGL